MVVKTRFCTELSVPLTQLKQSVDEGTNVVMKFMAEYVFVYIWRVPTSFVYLKVPNISIGDKIFVYNEYQTKK